MRVLMAAALVSLGVVSIGACAQIVGDFDNAGAGGGSTSSSSSSSSSSTSSASSASSTSSTSSGATCMKGSCQTASDCKAPAGDCATYSCVSGCCFPVAIAAGKPAAKQTAGDCATLLCNAAGQTSSMTDDTDTPTAGDPCHVGVCTAGIGGQAVNPVIAPCPLSPKQGVCGDPSGALAGMCVGCNKTADCGPNLVCDMANNCVSAACADGQKNGNETGIDCGGNACSPCALGGACLVAGDCGSSSCLNNVCVCPPGLTGCADACVDETKDPLNCGGCNTGCGVTMVCTGGNCACPSPTVDCGAAGCFDLVNDPAHCGGCNAPCTEAGQVCVTSMCQCPANEVLCATDGCADTLSSPTNCGQCGNVCLPGASCVSGVCTCPVGQTMCPVGVPNPGCADLTSDPQHCGICDVTCQGAPPTCMAGACSP